MAFKNKKEEVIDIQLTSYGKMLLSKGRFKPEFYTFYDDDILYDSTYASIDEHQNDSQIRILEETPVLENQVNYECVEDSVKKQISNIRRGLKNIREGIQPSTTKHYALSAPLGSSSKSSDNVPSWDITTYGAEIKSSSSSSQQQYSGLKIPQLELKEVHFYTEVVDPGIEVMNSEETTKEAGDVFPGHPFGVGGFTDAYPNNRLINVYENYLLLEIDELHTEPLKDNYDIELFVVEEDEVDGHTQESLKPLMFKRPMSYIYDGIYDEERFKREMREQSDDLSTPDQAAHYFDIFVDTEIDPAILCKLGYTTDFSKRGFIRVDCEEEKNLGESMYDVYDPFGREDGPYGDDC